MKRKRITYCLIVLSTLFYTLQSVAQYNYIIPSFDYTSNTTTYGRLNTLVKQPSYSPSVSFFSKYGFDITAFLYVLGNSDSTFEKSTTEFDLMIGYEWEPFENFTIYPSYSHFFYSQNSNSFKSGFNDNIQLDIDYSIKFYNTGLSGNYLFGENNTGLLTFRNSVILEKDDLFDNFYFAIQPGIDLTWGNQTYYKNEILDKLRSATNNKYEEILREFLSDPDVWSDIVQLRKRFPSLGRLEAIYLYISTQYNSKKEFNLNAITLNLPAYFMIGSQFSFIVNLMLYKPINAPKYIEDDWSFFWSTGISYTFTL